MKQKNVKHAHLPLIPDVALVEFPPKNADLSNITTDPPFSNIVCAAERPARPPPMTMTFLFVVSFIYIVVCVFSEQRCWWWEKNIFDANFALISCTIYLFKSASAHIERESWIQKNIYA